MLPRKALAASQSLASKPRLAVLFALFRGFFVLLFGFFSSLSAFFLSVELRKEFIKGVLPGHSKPPIVFLLQFALVCGLSFVQSYFYPPLKVSYLEDLPKLVKE